MIFTLPARIRRRPVLAEMPRNLHHSRNGITRGTVERCDVSRDALRWRCRRSASRRVIDKSPVLLGLAVCFCLLQKMKAGRAKIHDLAPRSRPEASAIHSRTAPVSDPQAAGGGRVFARAAEAALLFYERR